MKILTLLAALFLMFAPTALAADPNSSEESLEQLLKEAEAFCLTKKCKEEKRAIFNKLLELTDAIRALESFVHLTEGEQRRKFEHILYGYLGEKALAEARLSTDTFLD